MPVPMCRRLCASMLCAHRCVPSVPGCMMPLAASHSLSMTAYSTGAYQRKHTKDVGSANFAPGATVNQLSGSGACIVGRVGCMSSSALNYDSRATVNEGCFVPTEGCLDRSADNFNCTIKEGDVPCTTSVPRATVHSRALCNFGRAPPSPPSLPPPPLPAGKATAERPAVEMTLLAAGSVEDYDDTKRQSLKDSVAALNPGAEEVLLTIRPASVSITLQILFADLAAANSAASAMRTALGSSAAGASAALGISVQSVPSITAKVVVVVVDRPPSSGDSVIIGAAAGGGGGLLLVLVVLALLYQKRRRKRRLQTVDVDPGPEEKSRPQAWADE